jgi:hypothetical protein
MSDSIKKARAPFAQIANDVLNSPDLTFKAKGIYAYMVSKPNNWKFTIRSMATQVKDGRDGIQSGIKELKEAGWIKHIKRKDGTGVYLIRNDITRIKPNTDNPTMAADSQIRISPHTENPDQDNPDVLVIKSNSNKDKESNKDVGDEPSSPPPQPEIFIQMPLVGKEKTHDVIVDDVVQWKELYPGIDVDQHIRSMKGWLLSNPTKQKTKTGINRFINTWLSDEQNKIGRNHANHKHSNPTAMDRLRAAHTTIPDSKAHGAVVDENGNDLRPQMGQHFRGR